MTVDGREVVVADSGHTLLGLLRDQLGLTGPKDGCSPQGQCGCCTVLVDGQPRVACVTPARRVAGRTVVTIDGLDPQRADAWSRALCATGGSQCGFCTPGIILRLEGLLSKKGEQATAADVDQSLLAHLCRCTGWQTIGEAWRLLAVVDNELTTGPPAGRDFAAASQRASLEGGATQTVAPDVALGQGNFAADTAPSDALRAVRGRDGDWVVGETLDEARRVAGNVQGRRTTERHGWPLEVPGGTWDASLRTTWVEPAYLETDASWCVPGGEPTSPLANGGAFGAKTNGGKPWSPTAAAARRLADEHDRAVLALASREDTVRWGPKRPPVAGGANADGTGVISVVATPGVRDAIFEVAPGLRVEEVEVAGPETSVSLRAAGWAEALVLLAGARGASDRITAPNGAWAEATFGADALHVRVCCGQPLDEVVLRSYCIGAAHMAYSWVTSEALTVAADGAPQDLTVRSFGVVRAGEMPPVVVDIEPDDRAPRNGSDAVFAAVAAVTWLAGGCQVNWPTGETSAGHLGSADGTDGSV